MYLLYNSNYIIERICERARYRVGVNQAENMALLLLCVAFIIVSLADALFGD